MGSIIMPQCGHSDSLGVFPYSNHTQPQIQTSYKTLLIMVFSYAVPSATFCTCRILRCLVRIFVVVLCVVVILCVFVVLCVYCCLLSCVYCCSCLVYCCLLSCVYCCSCLVCTVVILCVYYCLLSCMYCCSCLVYCCLLSCVYCCSCLVCTVVILCVFAVLCVYCCFFLLWMTDCWLAVSTRKVLRQATSTQVFLGFPVSKSKF